MRTELLSMTAMLALTVAVAEASTYTVEQFAGSNTDHASTSCPR